MEKSLLINIAIATAIAVLSIGINASEKGTHRSHCECNNNICDGVENNTAIPNEAGCDRFFVCIDGRPIPNTCPPGQWFNYNISQCDNSTSPCDRFECPPDGIEFFPHDEYCDKFIMCFAGFPIPMRCADGLYFDRELRQCNFPEYTECELEVCPPENDPENIVFLPSDNYCDKYYICWSGGPIPFRCPEGLHFNPDIRNCDFPENANCTIDEPEKPPGAPLPHEIECKSNETIDFVSHPNSCEHYFICMFGQSIMLDCAPGFWFDSQNNWCDLPDNVKCDANIAPPPTDIAPTPTDSAPPPIVPTLPPPTDSAPPPIVPTLPPPTDDYIGYPPPPP